MIPLKIFIPVYFAPVETSCVFVTQSVSRNHYALFQSYHDIPLSLLLFLLHLLLFEFFESKANIDFSIFITFKFLNV